MEPARLERFGENQKGHYEVLRDGITRLVS